MKKASVSVLPSAEVPVSFKGTVNLRECADDDAYRCEAEKALDGVWVAWVNARHAANLPARCLR